MRPDRYPTPILLRFAERPLRTPPQGPHRVFLTNETSHPFLPSLYHQLPSRPDSKYGRCRQYHAVARPLSGGPSFVVRAFFGILLTSDNLVNESRALPFHEYRDSRLTPATLSHKPYPPHRFLLPVFPLPLRDAPTTTFACRPLSRPYPPIPTNSMHKNSMHPRPALISGE